MLNVWYIYLHLPPLGYAQFSHYTPATNIAMGILKMVLFHCYVSLPKGINPFLQCFDSSGDFDLACFSTSSFSREQTAGAVANPLDCLVHVVFPNRLTHTSQSLAELKVRWIGGRCIFLFNSW